MGNPEEPRRKPIFWQLTVALTCAAALTIAAGFFKYSNLRGRVEQDLLLTARAMNHAVANELSNKIAFTQMLGASLEKNIRERNFALAQHKASEGLKVSQTADHIVLTTESGQQVFNTLVEYGRPLPVTKNLERVKLVSQSGKPRVSNLITGTVSQHFEVLVDVPVILDGKVAYVLTTVLNVHRLQGVLSGQHLPNGWVAVLFDGNGSVVARTKDHENHVGKQVSESLMVQLRGRDSAALKSATLEGSQAMAAFAHNNVNGFGIATTVPKELLLKEVIGDLPATAIAISVAVFALLAIWRLSSDLKVRRLSENQMRQFVANAPVALAMFDREMNYLATSNRWVADYGRGYQDLIGRNHYEVHPDLPDEWKSFHRQGLAGNAVRNDSDFWIQTDGSKHWLRWAIVPWKEANGEVGGIIISTEDMTTYQQAQEALRSSEERLRRVSDNAGVGLTRCSRDLNYLSANPAYATIAGKPLDQIVGKPIIEVMGADATETIRPYFERVLRGEHVTYEAEVPFAGSGKRYLHVSYTPDVDAEGKTVGWVASVTDITSLRKAQLDLSESEERFRKLFDSAPIALATSDRQGRIVLMNREFEQLFGYRKDEVLTAQAFRERVFRAPLLQQQQEAWQETWLQPDNARHQTAPYELLAFGKDGSQKTILLTRQRMGEDLLVVMVDITQRKRAEEKVLELSQAIEQSPTAIVITDLDAKIQYVNDAYVESSGYTRQELLGQNPRILSSGKTPKENYDAMWSALTQGRVWKGELINKNKGGTEFIEFDVISPIRDAQGMVTQYVAVKQDITEKNRMGRELDAHRHRLEELIRERTAELQRAFSRLEESQFAMDGVGIGIHWIDVATGQFLETNRSGAEMFGYSREELLCMRVSELDPHHNLEEIKSKIDLAHRQGAIRFETFNRCKSGALIPIEVSLFYRAATDTTAERGIAFVTDITQRKRAESELVEAKEAADAANSAKSSFLANMSHEIRTPLNGVLGLAQIGYRDNAGRTKAQETFGRILDSGKQLLTIINDILDFSKIEAGKLAVETVPLNPARLVDETVRGMMVLASAKSIRLASDHGALPATVLGDPVRIRQILSNLLSNAIKFTEQGEVRQSTRWEGNELVIAVSDTGIGIAPEILESLFKPFEQGDSTTTRKFGGTGLGLAISRRLADLMGGTLEVESVLGHGSTFTLRLPLKETDLVAREDRGSMAVGQKRLAGLRLLVAEDNPVNQLVIEDLLQGEGAEVVLVANGQQAVDAVAQSPQPFNVVLMDVQMPEMDGLEATRLLKQSNPDLPVIGQTAHAMKEATDKCIQAGMTGTVNKPIDLEVLVSAVLEQIPASLTSRRSVMQSEDGAPPVGATVVDWVGLERRYPNRPDFIDRLVGLFLDGHAEDGERLRKLSASQDLTGIERLAHGLKGAAGNLFATEVQNLATHALESVRQNKTIDIEEVESLAAAMDRAIAEFKRGRLSRR